ncbi:hypothetical protein H5116_07715 [Pseudoalteromonas sp. SG45-2]|nr:hypothetical protein [Pseudoalteromonas sp. SG45-2]
MSGVVSFIFYFSWAFWANSAADIAKSVTFQAALVQGLYSGFVTLAFVTPIICMFHSKTPQNVAIRQSFNYAINSSASYLSNKKIAGVLFAPIIPITVQSSLVIMVNVVNQTPNLALTVAPSIFFTALYAYTYMLALLKK